MGVLCDTCTRNITSERFPGIKCSSCIKAFHVKCIGISDDLVKNITTGSANWLCPSCRGKSRKSIIDYNENTDAAETADNPTLHDVMIILKSVQNKLTELEVSQQFVSNIMDKLNNTVSLLAKENAAFKKKLSSMEKHLDDYENKLSELEANTDTVNQIHTSNNVVVSGLPSDSSNIGELFIKVAEKIGQTISNGDIQSIEKIKHRHDGGNSALKNAFIIKLKTPELKENILTNFRRKKSLYLDEIDGSLDKTRIIVLHHFTKYQSKLYNETKKFKVKYNFRFMWCRNNKILLRKLPEADVFHIRSFYDLIRLERGLSAPDEDAHPVRHSLD